MLLLFKTRIVSSFQLRYLQTLNSISAEHNSTVGDDKKKEKGWATVIRLSSPSRSTLSQTWWQRREVRGPMERLEGMLAKMLVCPNTETTTRYVCENVGGYAGSVHQERCQGLHQPAPLHQHQLQVKVGQGWGNIMISWWGNIATWQRNILDIRCFECVQAFMMVKEQKGKIKLCWGKTGDRSISAPKALLGKPVNVFLASINTTVHDVSEKTFNFRPNINYEKQNKQKTNCL